MVIDWISPSSATQTCSVVYEMLISSPMNLQQGQRLLAGVQTQATKTIETITSFILKVNLISGGEEYKVTIIC